mmetsp:Transcript_10605/g.22798  ORF Transcript_10605/g.22798 Transcript_10605/m.22798 type:complete len:267 (-) Transcript_10605:570-1370(-)
MPSLSNLFGCSALHTGCSCQPYRLCTPVCQLPDLARPFSWPCQAISLQLVHHCSLISVSHAYLGTLPSSLSTSPTRYSDPVTSTCSWTFGDPRAYCRSQSRAAGRQGATALVWTPAGLGPGAGSTPRICPGAVAPVVAVAAGQAAVLQPSHTCCSCACQDRSTWVGGPAALAGSVLPGGTGRLEVGRKPYCDSGGTNSAWWSCSPRRASPLDREDRRTEGSRSFMQLKRSTRRWSVVPEASGWAFACSANQSAHVAMLSGVCAPSM